MMNKGNEVAHQLVHGYRRGHEELVGSVELADKDADLVRTMSDLSGRLLSAVDFKSYLTLYPLEQSKFYALAKTWLDTDINRSGCVLTHTILLPLSLWAQDTSPESYLKLLRRPDRKRLLQFKTPIEISSVPPNRQKRFEKPPRTVCESFVERYICRDVKPIIWFEVENAEAYCFQIVRSLWPSLRARFACCTFSLQPRKLTKEPFDLLFAPSEVYSRFRSLGDRHFLSKSYHQITEDPVPEDWLQTLTDLVFDYPEGREIRDKFSKFFEVLPSKPSSIQSIFLFEELTARLQDSPTAIIGVLDLIESIAPRADEGLDFKSPAVETAIVALSEVVDQEEALLCYSLLCDRLDTAAYSQISLKEESNVLDRVARLTQSIPEQALGLIEEKRLYQSKLTPLFARGVIEGFLDASRRQPAFFNLFLQYEQLVPFLFNWSAKLPRQLMRSISAGGVNDQVRKRFPDWLLQTENLANFNLIRKETLSEISSNSDAPILRELLRCINGADVGSILEQLSLIADFGNNMDLLNVVKDSISKQHSNEVRTWCHRENWKSWFATVLASTYSEDKYGLSQLMDDEDWSVSEKSRILCGYIESQEMSDWLIEALKQRPEITLLLIESDLEDCSVIVERILSSVRYVPLSQIHGFSTRISDFASRAYFDHIIHTCNCSAILTFIDDSLSKEECRQWLSNEWSISWAAQVDLGELKSVMLESAWNSPHSWLRAWQCVTLLPDMLYSRTPLVVIDLVQSLLPRFDWTWKSEVETSWIKIIRRTKRLSSADSYHQMCAISLDYCLRNWQLPVSKVVVECFYPSYVRVLREEKSKSEIFRFFTWDRAKELRRSLVNAYLSSKWDPGDLALAANDRNLLRKIFKRVLSDLRGGRDYVARMISSLDSSKSGESELANDLRDLASSPNFFEEWI